MLKILPLTDTFISVLKPFSISLTPLVSTPDEASTPYGEKSLIRDSIFFISSPPDTNTLSPFDLVPA